MNNTKHPTSTWTRLPGSRYFSKCGGYYIEKHEGNDSTLHLWHIYFLAGDVEDPQYYRARPYTVPFGAHLRGFDTFLDAKAEAVHHLIWMKTKGRMFQSFFSGRSIENDIASMDKPKTTWIKASTPLCKELQGGHDSYYEGLLLADSHTIAPDGSWIVEHEGKKANVHPFIVPGMTRNLGFHKHNGQNVYGIRYWI